MLLTGGLSATYPRLGTYAYYRTHLLFLHNKDVKRLLNLAIFNEAYDYRSNVRDHTWRATTGGLLPERYVSHNAKCSHCGCSALP